MNSFQLFRRLPILSLLVTLVVLLLPTSAPCQDKAGKGNLYSNEKYMFTIELPEGFSAWGEDATKEFFDKSRNEQDMPEEFKEQTLKELPTLKTIFQPEGQNLSNQSIIIHAGIPIQKSLDEFEASYNVPESDCVTLSKKTLTVNYRTCFLVDREFDNKGLRFRQLMAFIQGIGPVGYLINFNAIAVDFNEYRDMYMECLKTFKVEPPKTVPPELKQRKYSQKVKSQKDSKPAWRSVEVIGSFIFVAIIVIWFMLKRLSAGAAGQNMENLPGAPDSEIDDMGDDSNSREDSSSQDTGDDNDDDD